MYGEYEKIFPGTAERILRMAEVEQSARIDLQRKHLTNSHDLNMAGLRLTAIISIVMFLGGSGGIYAGRLSLGIIQILTGIALLIGSSIYRRRSTNSSKERSKGSNPKH